MSDGRCLISDFEPGKLYRYAGEVEWMPGYAPVPSTRPTREIMHFKNNDVVLCVEEPKWKLAGKTLHYTCLVLHKETVMLLHLAYQDNATERSMRLSYCGWVPLT